MRREPHSYPWCNLEGVKTPTVGKEQGSAKQTLYKQKYSARPASLLLNPGGGGRVHNLWSISTTVLI